jgi:hypothetical protein
MTALDVLKELRASGIVFFPWRKKDGGIIAQPSNSDLFRWLNEGAVELNGVCPKAKDEATFPVTSLVFFPKKPQSRTTIY